MLLLLAGQCLLPTRRGCPFFLPFLLGCFSEKNAQVQQKAPDFPGNHPFKPSLKAAQRVAFPLGGIRSGRGGPAVAAPDAGQGRETFRRTSGQGPFFRGKVWFPRERRFLQVKGMKPMSVQSAGSSIWAATRFGLPCSLVERCT